MPSNNRRSGGSGRPAHLTVAPPPAESAPPAAVNETASSVAEEAPFETSGNVAFMLTPDELTEMLERHQEQSTSSTPTGLLEVPARRDHEQTDDKDAAFEPATTEPPVRQLADVELSDEQPKGAHTGVVDAPGAPVELDPPSIEEPERDRDSAWSDPDPTFEKLALSSTTPARTLGAPGSASTDTAPIRPARRRAPRATDARSRRAAARRLGRRSVIGALVVLGLIVSAIVLQRPSRTPTTSSRPVASSAPALGLTALREAFAPIAHDLTAISTRTGAAGPGRRAHSSSVRHRPTRTRHRQRPVRSVHRTAATTAERTQRVPITTAPATAVSSPASSPTITAPASPAPASSGSSSQHSASGSGAASPPPYGEGGVLGAGHSG